MVIGDLALQSARRYPDKKAMVFEEQSRTYREFNDRVNRLAHSLAGAGLKAGDKVGVLCRNNIEMFEICFAAAKMGMLWVPLNFRLVPAELRFVINDAELGILFVGDPFTEVIATIRGEIDVPHVIDLGPEYEKMVASGPIEEPKVKV
jgi:acyl-CoA synthetase (AMP-forming)/AMP-acid ligase II